MNVSVRLPATCALSCPRRSIPGCSMFLIVLYGPWPTSLLKKVPCTTRDNPTRIPRTVLGEVLLRLDTCKQVPLTRREARLTISALLRHPPTRLTLRRLCLTASMEIALRVPWPDRNTLVHLVIAMPPLECLLLSLRPQVITVVAVLVPPLQIPCDPD